MKKSTEWDRSFRPTTYWKAKPNKKAVAAGYLPDLEPGEVEIARIEMLSTLSDVISLRAQRDADGRIHHRFCDEYPEDEKVYEFSPVVSDEPLSFGEVADLLDNARCSDAYEDEPRVIWGILQMNRDNGLDDQEQLEGFVRVVSPFYPQLTEYFRWRTRQWLAQGVRAARAEEKRAQRLDAERRRRLVPFAAEIDAIVERETAKCTWSGSNAGMGRGMFRQKLRRRLEDIALETGQVPGEVPRVW
jgi:hypothetical protein